jgi:hypothetical protein
MRDNYGVFVFAYFAAVARVGRILLNVFLTIALEENI